MLVIRVNAKMRKKHSFKFYLKNAYYPAFTWALPVCAFIALVNLCANFYGHYSGNNPSPNWFKAADLLFRGTGVLTLLVGSCYALVYYFNILEPEDVDF